MLFLVACFAAVSAVNGGTLWRARFSWEAVADPVVSGYKIHWGTASGVYTHTLDAGNVTEVLIAAFADGVEYFSAITAYSNTGETSDYSAEVSFSVPPAGGATAPLITAKPTATAIIYGQTLASSTLSGGAVSVPGCFVFTTPVTAPTVGASAQSVTFIPTDTLSYQTVTTSVSVTVFKATPLITTQPTATDIIYGRPLASSALSGGAASVPGYFGFTTPGTASGPGGTLGGASFSWEAVADPVVSGYKVHWGVASGIYTHTLDAGNVTEVIISGFSEGVEYFSAVTAYSSSGDESGYSAEVSFTLLQARSTTAPVVGTSAQSVTFTPTDTSSYEIVTTSVNVTVLKATPWITKKPTAKAIVHGQTLASSTLRRGLASVGGSFAFTTPTMVPAAGTSLQSVTFSPTDTSNYQTVTTIVSVTVRPSALVSNAPESLENWRARCFSPEQTATGQAADDADPDWDGLVNLAEYALGTSPLVFTPPSTAVKNIDGLVLTFERPAGLPDVLYAAASSDDLIHWNPCLLEMVADGPLQTMRAIDPLTSGNPARRFISLRFTRPSKSGSIAAESLENWRARCFSPEQITAGQAADDADPDRDGLVNLAEYALGTSPLAFTPPLTAVKNSAGLVLTFERPAGLPDVLYAAASSDDLIHWNPCLLEMVADGPVQTMRAIDPLTSGNPARRFIALRFTKP